MRSIRTKLIALLLCCVLLSSAIVGIMCIAQTSSILEENAKDNMVLLCEKNAKSLNTTLNGIQTSVDTLAHYVIENLVSTDVIMNGDSEEYQQYLTKISQVGTNHASSLNGTLSVYAIFDPKVYGENKGFFFKANDKGEMIPQSVGALTQNDTYISESWWNEPVSAGESVWITNYDSEGSPATLYFSYIVPIYYNNEFLGVIGMEFPDGILRDITSDIKLKQTGFAVILDHDGRIITHPKYATGTLISLTGDEFQDISNQFEKQGAAASELSEYDINTALCREIFPYEYNETEHFITFCTLRNGMVLCLNAPINEIYEQQAVMMRKIIFIIVVVALSMLLVAFIFANYITNPIVSLNKAARSFTEGDFNTAVVPTTKDEIGELAKSIERTRVRMKSYIDELYIEAHIDGLTGTPNKAAYLDEEKLLNAQIADGSASFSVAVFDVNYLKMTNDTFGHMAGDELLKKIAICLKEAFGPQNVFRMGGDEFVALIYGEEKDERIYRATQCIAHIESQTLENIPDIPITCSMGIADFDPNHDNFLADTVTRADSMMYKNKANFKKKTPFWDMDLKTMHEIQINRYLEFLSILSTSMEAYLFLIDITQDKIWFFNNMNNKFPIAYADSGTNTIEEMINLVHPSDRDALIEDLNKVMSGETVEHNMNYRWINNDGMPIWINGHGKVVNDANGKPFLMLGRISDTMLRKWYNPLTGLFNKDKFAADYREQKTAPFRRFVLINIDNLSLINLKHGRKYGDDAMLALSTALSEKFPNNILYHMEKDHFAVLLDTQDNDEISAAIDEIRTAVNDKISISAAIVPNEKQYYIDADSIYEYARHMLKNNKSKGGNITSFFTEKDFAKTLSNIEMIEELEKSIYHNNFDGFFLCYQPQIDAKTHNVVSAEVLLRYTSPVKGVVYPNDFIPLLERTQMIREVGMWVLDEALAQCVLWRKTLPNLGISVNFSPVQLKDENLADKVLDILKKHDIPYGALTLELTECVELEDTALYSECFSKLRGAGIHIAIDDFGTGYANLSYLKKIQADQLKIDQLFVKDVRQGSLNFTLINNVVQFARANGFIVCMEGVETVEELSVLELIDPDILQGYIFNKPIIATEFEEKYITPDKPVEWDFKEELSKQRERLRFAYFDAANILSQTKIGLWMLNLNETTGEGNIYADDILRQLLGMENITSPQDCYEFIFSRTSEEDRSNVSSFLQAMKENHHVTQLEYYWEHPTHGRILIRCTGKFVSAKDNVLMFEGFLRILGNNQN